MRLTVEKASSGLFVRIPEEVLAQLGWGHGDILSADVVGQGLRIERTLTAHDHALEIARRCMDEYREVFERLAKS